MRGSESPHGIGTSWPVELSARAANIAETEHKQEYCPELCTDARIALRLCFGHPEHCATCDLYANKYCNWGIEAVKRWKAGSAFYDAFREREVLKKRRDMERIQRRRQRMEGTA